MEEIAEFLGDDPAARLIFQGMVALCRLAAVQRLFAAFRAKLLARQNSGMWWEATMLRWLRRRQDARRLARVDAEARD